MDWNSILDNTAVLWGALGFAGLNTGLNVIKFLNGILSGKNVKKLLSFTAIADKSIKDTKIDLISLKKEVVESFKKEIVAPLVAQVKKVKDDNEMLANIAVTALSLANVPLDQKKELFNALNKINSISQETQNLLNASIQTAEKQQEEEKQEDEELNETINNI